MKAISTDVGTVKVKGFLQFMNTSFTNYLNLIKDSIFDLPNDLCCLSCGQHMTDHGYQAIRGPFSEYSRVAHVEPDTYVSVSDYEYELAFEDFYTLIECNKCGTYYKTDLYFEYN